MTRAQVLSAINAIEGEVTTEQLAQHLRTPRYAASSALSKLAAYGAIRKRAGAPANGFFWSRVEGAGDEACGNSHGHR